MLKLIQFSPIRIGGISGSIKDTIQLFATGPDQWIMLITNRHFIVTQVFQPELMTPVPYHGSLPPLSQ